MKALVQKDWIDYRPTPTFKLYENGVEITELIVATAIRSALGDFDVVDIDGGTIDGVLIGATTPITGLYGKNCLFSINNNTQLMSSLSAGLLRLYRDGTLTPQIMLSTALGSLNYLNVADIVFGGNTKTYTQNYEFKGSARITSDAYINGALYQGSTNVGSEAALFATMSDAVWAQMINLTINQVSYLRNIGLPINATNWNRLAVLNNDLTQSSTPTFAGLTLTGTLNGQDISGGSITGGSIIGTSLNTAGSSSAGVHISTSYTATPRLEYLHGVNAQQQTIITAEIDLSLWWGAGSFLRSVVKRIDPEYIHKSPFSATSIIIYEVAIEAYAATALGTEASIALSDLGMDFDPSDDEHVIIDLWGRSYNRDPQTEAPRFFRLIDNDLRSNMVTPRYAYYATPFVNGGLMGGSSKSNNIFGFGVWNDGIDLLLSLYQETLAASSNRMRLSITGKIIHLDS